jgi:hypothetical protein
VFLSQSRLRFGIVGRRTWTDGQLRDAVARQSSWRGVLRALGLAATSGGSIGVVKRRAQDLGLDTSHFTGRRRWSDEELQDAIAISDSWPEVAQRLGLIKERRTGLRLKGDALRLGFDVSHLDVGKASPSIDPLSRPPLVSELRRAAPSIAAAWFGLRGFGIAYPAEPEDYDLLATGQSEIFRIQVKSTTSKSSAGKWQVGIGQRPYSGGSTAPRTPYDPDSIDFFFIVNASGDLYLLPIEAVAGLTNIYLSAYEEYWVGDVSSLLAGAC